MKIKKISYKKILLDYIVDIKSGDIKISEIRIKPRYLIINGKLSLIQIKDRFFNQLSNKYGIKKKNIYCLRKNEPFHINIDGEEYHINDMISEIQLNDPKWFIQWNRNNVISGII